MRKIKAGIIGVGFIGPIHMEGLRRLGHDVAICEANETLAKESASRYGVDEYYSDWNNMIQDPSIDVIHVCAPNHLHYPITMAALEAGKHVVCDKPLSLNIKECEEMARKAKEVGVVNAVTYDMCMYPMIKQAAAMVRNGEIGKINYVQGYYLQDWLFYDTDYNWRVESKFQGESRIVSDIGGHCLHMIMEIIGQDICEVFADVNTFHKTRKKPAKEVATFAKITDAEVNDIEIDTDDQATVLLRFCNGAKGVFTGGQVFAGRKNRVGWEIYGDKKSIAWNGEEPNQIWIGNRDTANGLLMKDYNLVDESVSSYCSFSGGLQEGYSETWKNLMNNIYAAITEGKQGTNYPTFEDGLKMERIVEATVKSSRENKWVSVE